MSTEDSLDVKKDKMTEKAKIAEQAERYEDMAKVRVKHGNLASVCFVQRCPCVVLLVPFAQCCCTDFLYRKRLHIVCSYVLCE